MFELRIERRFFASHALRLYDGSFEPPHAHDWRVEVVVRAAKLDAIDVAIDFHELERIVAAALDPLRDTHLNDQPVFTGKNPSAERVAEHIHAAVASKLPEGVELVSATITEAPGCRATFRSSLPEG